MQFRTGLCPGPRWGRFIYDAPPHPLYSRLGRGTPLPIPHLLDAFGVSPTVPHHFSKPVAASVWSHRMHRNRIDAAYCYKRRTFRGLRVYVRVCMR